MLLSEVGFNLLLALLDAAALAAIWRRPRAASLAILSWALLALPLALVCALGVPYLRAFFVARLLAWALFCHGPVCWGGLAWILRRRAAAAPDPVAGEAPAPGRRGPAGAALVALLLAGVALEAFVVEPRWLTLRRVRVSSARLTQPLKIVLLADLQTDALGAFEREVLARVVAEKPDLILLAGDYLQCWDEEAYAREAEALRAALHEAGFQAPLGVFAVGGDCETPAWPSLFAGTAVRPLCGVAEIGSELRLQGLSLSESARGAPDLPESERFTIALGHRPDFALSPTRADLLLAGHTHGGQVQLPFFGPLVTLSRVPRAWAGGEPTKLPQGGTLIVSRGVGMERVTAPRLRFLCRPELVVVEVLPLQPGQ